MSITLCSIGFLPMARLRVDHRKESSHINKLQNQKAVDESRSINFNCLDSLAMSSCSLSSLSSWFEWLLLGLVGSTHFSAFLSVTFSFLFIFISVQFFLLIYFWVLTYFFFCTYAISFSLSSVIYFTMDWVLLFYIGQCMNFAYFNFFLSLFNLWNLFIENTLSYHWCGFDYLSMIRSCFFHGTLTLVVLMAQSIVVNVRRCSK